jgi:prepilin-type N-terminal cleavage/methylation domain-containing protein
MRTKQMKKNHGFTIIEVMIVLAIAALILAIIFLAVPALRRSANNNQRRTDANNILALVSEYAGNEGGALPAVLCYNAGPPITVDAAGGTCAAETNKVTTNLSGQITTVDIAAAVPGVLPAMTTSTAHVYGTATCSNNNTPVAGSSARSIAIYYELEPAVTQCTSS